jgi:hypothetical protein
VKERPGGRPEPGLYIHSAGPQPAEYWEDRGVTRSGPSVRRIGTSGAGISDPSRTELEWSGDLVLGARCFSNRCAVGRPSQS